MGVPVNSRRRIVPPRLLYRFLMRRHASKRRTQVELAWRLRWVAKRTRKSPKKKHLKTLSSISLPNNRLKDITRLGWPNGEKIANLNSTKMSASQRKCTPNGVASRPKFTTCVYLRLGRGLNFFRALGLGLPVRNGVVTPLIKRQETTHSRPHSPFLIS